MYDKEIIIISHDLLSGLACCFFNLILFSCHCSVMTPYYSEETVYSRNDLEMDNEDGVSIIYYLRKIFPGPYIH